MVILSEQRILELILEAKTIPSGLVPLGALPQRSNHFRKDYKITCPSGNEFLLALRRSAINMLDFSVILGFQLPHLHTVFRLRRYNGKSHRHTNAIEKETFYDFHFHIATERYQRPGYREDTFAQVTERYQTLEGAIQCLLEDCGFLPPSPQLGLFASEGRQTE
jgi:hypothetical protein